MRITSSSLFSVILALSMFSIGAVADRVSSVYVTNFPLDAQGNMRVSSSRNSKVLTIFKDLPVSFARDVSYYPSDPIEVGEFNEAYLYISIRDWTTTWSPFRLSLYSNLYGNVDGIRSFVVNEGGSRIVEVREFDSVQPHNATARFLVWAPTIQIEIYTQGDPPMGFSGSGHISISLYLKS